MHQVSEVIGVHGVPIGPIRRGALRARQVGEAAVVVEGRQCAPERRIGIDRLLARANAQIAAVNEVVAGYPSPHVELARLTQLLGDDVYLEQFAMDGAELNLRGRAADAAAVMERLSDVKEYAEVTAPRAITRVPGSGQEQFFLTIRLRPEAEQ